MHILNPNENYTFRKYFELSFLDEDILKDLGYTLQRTRLPLIQAEGDYHLLSLKDQLEETLTFTALSSESARQQTLIAPILITLCRYTGAKLKIEYPIQVNNLLKGELDYLIETQTHVLVVEAKQADLARGFTQLAVELIALSEWLESTPDRIFGSVTTGDIWRFGLIQPAAKIITQDITLWKIPEDLEPLFATLVWILQAS